MKKEYADEDYSIPGEVFVDRRTIDTVFRKIFILKEETDEKEVSSKKEKLWKLSSRKTDG